MRTLFIAGSMIAVLLSRSAHAALTVSSQPTQNMTCSGGACIATARKAVLNVTDLANMIAESPVAVQSGSQAKDIVFDAPFSWTNGNALALDAYRAITVEGPVTVAGSASLSFKTNDGGQDGNLRFTKFGRINFLSTSNALSINGSSYALTDNIATLSSAVNTNPDGHYALSADYDAAVDGIYENSPISIPFKGVFEGLGNSISNLHVSSRGVSLLGFFSIVATGTVENFRLLNADVRGGATTTGALAGKNTGVLFNDFIDAKVQGKHYTGGLVGMNKGLVSNSSSKGSVSSNYFIGLTGGLVGVNSGSIEKSFSTGHTKGSPNRATAGGLAGVNYGLAGASITDSYSTGAVMDARSVAGFSGADGGIIATSYSIGAVTSGGEPAYCCGFVTGPGAYANCYWDITTSGTSRDGSTTGVTGLTDEQLKSGLPAGFDPAVWAQSPNINNGYPYLIDNPPRN